MCASVYACVYIYDHVNMSACFLCVCLLYIASVYVHEYVCISL